MKRIMLVALAASVLGSAAYAGEGGLGFRSLGLGPTGTLPNLDVGFSTTPALGIRHWVNDRMGFDAAVGFVSVKTEVGPPSTDMDEGTGFVFDLGVPISGKKWDKVNVIFRPGLLWGTVTAKDKTVLTPPNEEKTTLFAASGEIEVEFMVAERLGVSAAHGIAWRSIKSEDNDTPASETKITAFGATGGNFTSLGFHVYLW